MASNANNDLLRQLDDETAALIRQLQLQDSRESEFKAAETNDEDLKLARQLQQEELDRIVGVLEDGRLARQIQDGRIQPNLFEYTHRRLGRHHRGILPAPMPVARPQEIITQAAATPTPDPAPVPSSRRADAQANTLPNPTPVVSARPTVISATASPVPAQSTNAQAVTPPVPSLGGSIEAQSTADGAEDTLGGATSKAIDKAGDVGKIVSEGINQAQCAARGAGEKLVSTTDTVKDLVVDAAGGITNQAGSATEGIEGDASGIVEKTRSTIGVTKGISGLTDKASGTLSSAKGTAGLTSEGDIAQTTTPSASTSQKLIEPRSQPTISVDPSLKSTLQSTTTNESPSQTIQPSEVSPTRNDEVQSLLTSTNDNTATEEHLAAPSETSSSVSSTAGSQTSDTTTTETETGAAGSPNDFKHENASVLKNGSDQDNSSTSSSISDNHKDEVVVAEPDIKKNDSETGKNETLASPPTNTTSESTQEQVKKPEIEQYECAICVQDNFTQDEVIYLSCKHHVCKKCLEEMFDQSLSLTGLFPPRCCTPITSISGLEKLLKPGVRMRFEAKMIEITTKNPLFCSVEACSAFILPEAILYDKATCLKCYEVTCTKCRKYLPNGLHDDILCDLDISTKELRAFMKLNKYQECPNCKNGISMHDGCNHMTCTACRAEWCYVCLRDNTKFNYSEHKCPQYSDGNVYGRSDKKPINIPAPSPGQSYEEMLDEILKCTHKDIRRVKGAGKCDRCEYEMPNYHFKCANDCFQMCERCLDAKHPGVSVTT